MLSTSLVFRMPQSGGVGRGAVHRNTILFPLKAYSLWNLCKAAASVSWRCTTRQCWLNCRSTLQRNGHNFIGLDGDFFMTTHSLTSCSFWLNLTLPPYSPNLASCDFFLFPSLQGFRFETSEAVLKKSELCVIRKTLKGSKQTSNMEGGQSGTYLRLMRASSGPWVSVAKTYMVDETKRKWIFRPDHSGLPQQ